MRGKIKDIYFTIKENDLFKCHLQGRIQGEGRPSKGGGGIKLSEIYFVGNIYTDRSMQ